MSYQRWDKPGRFYVYMGQDGLHILPSSDHGNDSVVLLNNVAGRDNAAAILRGCVDLLVAQGMSVEIRKGKVSIEKKP